MLQIIDIAGTILSLIGAILIVKKQWYGYVIWCFSNACWVYIALSVGAWGQAFTFGVLYIIVNIWGIYEWRKPPIDRCECKIERIPEDKLDKITLYENHKPVIWSDMDGKI